MIERVSRPVLILCVGLAVGAGCVLLDGWKLTGVRAAMIQRTHAGLMLAHFLGNDGNSGVVEPRIRVVRRPVSASVIREGSTFNVHPSFMAEGATSVAYTLQVFLVDEGGREVGYAESSLQDGLIVLPTTRWVGPVSVTLPVVAPVGSKGRLTILTALRGAKGRVTLAGTSDFKPDGEARYAIGSVLVATSALGEVDAAADPPDLSRYERTFDEEFESLSISDAQHHDGSRWYALNEQCCMMATDGARTQMSGVQGGDSPFSLGRPKGLNIHLRRKGDVWSSGVLTSVDSKGVGFSQQYGYFEMRARFPVGEDTWPAFWLLNTAAKSAGAAPGEIDVVEYIANHRFAQYMSTTLHDWSDKSTPAMSHHPVALPSDGFHRYGMLWTAKTTTFYFDGVVMFQCPTPSIMHQPYYLLVDLGLGSGWPTEHTPAENTMVVDWIRVYRERGAAAAAEKPL